MYAGQYGCRTVCRQDSMYAGLYAGQYGGRTTCMLDRMYAGQYVCMQNSMEAGQYGRQDSMEDRMYLCRTG